MYLLIFVNFGEGNSHIITFFVLRAFLIAQNGSIKPCKNLTQTEVFLVVRRERWCWFVVGSRVKWKVRGNDLISRLRKNMDRKIGTFICLSKRYLYLQLATLSTVDNYLDLYNNNV